MSAVTQLPYYDPPGRSGARIDLLPRLPLELQIQILSQIPPTKLFTLRCTSVAWNVMLSNPHVLEYIHNHKIPYLTSAMSLESRLKRRQRLQRNQPVWFSVLEDVFPWASVPTKDSGSEWEFQIFERFWNGCLVVFISPQFLWDFTKIRQTGEQLVLKIGHVLTPKNVTEVDIGQLIEEKFPELEKREIDGEWMPVGKAETTPRFLHVQDNIILLGVLVSLRPKGEPRRVSMFYSPIISGKSLEMLYVFAFDIAGTLLCHIPLPYRDPNDAKIVRFNPTHLLVFSTQHARRKSDALGGSSPVMSFTINIYLLSTGQRVAREIAGRLFRDDAACLPMEMGSDKVPDPVNVVDINFRLGFDELGMIWFPRFNLYKLEFSFSDEGLVWESSNLPWSPCGGWVIFSGIHGCLRDSGARHAPDSGKTSNEAMTQRFTESELSQTQPQDTTTEIPGPGNNVLLINCSKKCLMLSHDCPFHYSSSYSGSDMYTYDDGLPELFAATVNPLVGTLDSPPDLSPSDEVYFPIYQPCSPPTRSNSPPSPSDSLHPIYDPQSPNPTSQSLDNYAPQSSTHYSQSPTLSEQSPISQVGNGNHPASMSEIYQPHTPGVSSQPEFSSESNQNIQPYRSYSNLIFQSWNSKSGLRYPSTHRIKIFTSDCRILGPQFEPCTDYDYTIAASMMPNISSLWGYVTHTETARPPRPDCRDWLRSATSLLPYENGSYLKTAQTTFDTMQWRSGGTIIRWLWGDDGLMAWKRSGCKRLLVCYEEEWDLKSTEEL